MKNKLLIRINNLLEIEEYYKEGITNFLFPLSCYSIGYNTFNLDEIKNIKEKYNINVYLLANRVLDNKDCNNFKLIIRNFSFVNGIIYEDIAIYQMLKDTNINLIWNQAHFAVNYHSINYWLSKDNIISCMLANELEKNELKTVLDNVNKKVILPILGLNMAIYSRRTLLKFYSDTFKTKYTNVAILKNDAVEFLAKENEYGTVLFYNKYFNLIPELEHINDDKIFMYYIDPNGLTFKDVIAILNGKAIDYDNKFYENKTVYKVSDLK